MAIIPATDKVYMVREDVNTTYGGSAALNVMQQWYTMQDIIDTIGFISYSGGVYAQTALGNPIVFASGEASLIGTGVGALSIPANTLQVGDSFAARLCGNLTCANNQSIHIRIKSDGNVIADTGVFVLSAATDKFFELIIDFTITKIGGLGVGELFVNGQFSYNKNANNIFEGTNFALIDSTDFDTTTVNSLSITAEWVTNNAANVIRSQNFVLTRTY